MPNETSRKALPSGVPSEATIAIFARQLMSDHTRQAYARIVAEFLRTLGHPDPRDVTPDQILAWRDELVRRKQKPNAVCLKLSVVRSFYECLMAGGYVSMNPATTKPVPPPALPEDLAGKALTPKEVKRLLAAQIESRREC